MKPDQSPRALLLERSAAAAPRLDALRRAALPPAEITPGEFLAEIFRPHRIAWRTLAAVWLLLLALQLAVVNPARPPAFAGPAPSPQAVAAWFAQLNLNPNPYETLAQTDRHP